jgi:histidine triad (HIT) family protein
MAADCLFCRIVAGEVPSTKVDEDDTVLAIRDINPQAPTHILLMSKVHIASAQDLGKTDGGLLGAIFAMSADLADREGVASTGYRVVTNVGDDGGQSVDHLHFHLLGGRRLTWPPG